MKYKIIYQNMGFYFEGDADNEKERKELVKGLIYATKDLVDNKLLTYPQTFESGPVCYANEDVSEPAPVEEEPQIEYATEGQRRYMAKLGIPFTDETTKIEAIDLINAYKTAHGIPLRKK